MEDLFFKEHSHKYLDSSTHGHHDHKTHLRRQLWTISGFMS